MSDRVLVTCILAFLAVGCGPSAKQESVQNGRIDLSAGLPADRVVTLNGHWDFRRGISADGIADEKSKPTSADARGNSPALLRVPAAWNGQLVQGQPLPAHGAGTYSLKILAPKTRGLSIKVFDIASASHITLNGRTVWKAGQVSANKQDYKPVWNTGVFPVRLLEGENALRVEVANFSYHKGGLWKPIELGLTPLVIERHSIFNHINLALFGALCMMGVYYLLFYILRPRAYAELFLSAFCFLTAVRTLVVDNRLLQSFFPGLSFEFLMKVEFFSFYLGIPAFFLFLFVLVRGALWKPVVYTYLATMLALNITVAVTPASFYGGVNPIVVLISILFGAYVLIALGVAAARGKEDALFPLIGGVIFLVASVNDGLKTREILQTPTMLPLGLFAFVAMQAFALSRRAERNRRATEAMSAERAEMGNALRRFVPEEFLAFLGRDLRTIQIGQAVEVDLSISFADIRNFTNFSEGLGSQETMRFLNGYYQRTNPLIKRNNGFIDKFIGDGLMALFPMGADDAVRAASETVLALAPYNTWRKTRGWETIRIGIGINSGPVTLGTIGDDIRMDTTVVGDTVNLAARVESLNKRLHTTILITAATRKLLTEQHLLREVAFLQVRGKEQPITLYECYDGDTEELRDQKAAAESDLVLGLSLYQAGEIQAAYERFVAAGKLAPTDPIPALHIDRCRAQLADQSKRRRTRVLIVEDNPAMRMIMERMFGLQGMHPTWAVDAAQAQALLAAQDFDVLISDLHLPDGDGLDLIHEAQARARGPMQCLLLTADDSPSVRERAQAGDVGIFIKPADLEALVRIAVGVEAADRFSL